MNKIFYFFINWLSIIKHTFYCNKKGFVYVKFKSDEYIPDILPKLDVRIDVLRNENDLKKYWKNPEILNTKEKFRYWLKNGLIGYFAVFGKEITSYTCIADVDIFHPDLFLDQPLFQGKNNYYFFNDHTFIKYRRNKIYEYTIINIFREFAHKGNIFVLVDEDNSASQKSNIKIGMKKFGTLKHIQFLWLILVSSFVSDDEKDTLLE